jgi:hypothetical protein
MAVGDLSPDQARFVDLVAGATRLDRKVVVAWVGSESGWGTNKASHNYLNVGPGRTYPSTELAAANTAALVNASQHYGGIRSAIPAGPAAQVKAIGTSPWGTSGALLGQVYGQLTGLAPAGPTATPTVENVNLLSDAASDAAKAAAGLMFGGPLGGLLANSTLTKGIKDLTGIDLVGGVVSAGLTIVFTVAAFALIAMGVNRLTGGGLKSTFDTVSGAVGTVAGAAKLAAI